MTNKGSSRGRRLLDLVLNAEPSCTRSEDSLITPEDLGLKTKSPSPSVLSLDLFDTCIFEEFEETNVIPKAIKDLNQIPSLQEPSLKDNTKSADVQKNSSDDDLTPDTSAANIITTCAVIHQIPTSDKNKTVSSSRQQHPESRPDESLILDYNSDDSVKDPHWFPEQQKRRRLNFSIDGDDNEVIRNWRSVENSSLPRDFEISELVRSNHPKKKENREHKNKKARVLGETYLGFKKQGVKYTRSAEKPKKNIKRRCSHTKISAGSKSKHAFLCALISDQEREIIHSYFWKLGSWAEKKTFVRAAVVRRKIRRRRKDRVSSKKTAGHDIYLNISDVNCTRVKVCRLFFLNTLNIGEDCFRRWTKTSETIQIENNGNDKQVCTSENEPGVMNVICQIKYTNKTLQVKIWLDLLPKVPSHYCRASSKKIYVEATFRSEKHMHEVFLDWCKGNSCATVSRPTFLKVLKQENIAIHHPRKDQCDTCCSFKTGNISQIEYDDHISKQKEARQAKQDAIQLTNNKIVVITVDVQSVLLAPKLLASAVYYKLKLQCHNFTVYDCKTKDVTIYFWHEVDGGVCANEFTSCVIDYLKCIPGDTEKVIIISDGCGHQNRNKILSSALSDFSQRANFTIEQLYLEKGHTMMEVDSVHSTIEQYIKAPIYAPSEYVLRMAQARPRQPYKIKSLHYNFFSNFEELDSNFKSIRPGKKKGDPVVTDIRRLKYLPDGSVSYKLRHSDEWTLLPQRRSVSSSPPQPKMLYNAPLKITESKFKHLQELKTVVDRDYHPFYDSITFNPGT